MIVVYSYHQGMNAKKDQKSINFDGTHPFDVLSKFVLEPFSKDRGEQADRAGPVRRLAIRQVRGGAAHRVGSGGCGRVHGRRHEGPLAGCVGMHATLLVACRRKVLTRG